MPDPAEHNVNQHSPVKAPEKDKESTIVSEPRPEYSQRSFYETEKPEEDLPEAPPPVIIPTKPASNVVFNTLKINLPSTSTPSSKEEVALPTALPKDKVSSATFVSAWAEMANSFAQDSQSLFVALTSHEPKINSEGVIFLMVDNSVQETLIADRKTEILNHLWKRLNNFSLSLEINIAENNFQQKAFHPQDKLQQMIQKNPAVLDLCKNLDLDFNY